MQKFRSKLDPPSTQTRAESIIKASLAGEGDWFHKVVFSSIHIFVALCVLTSELIYLAFYLYSERSGEGYIYGFAVAFFIPLFIGYILGTSRIKLTNELAETNTRLKQLYETSDQLLTILAHDVRGPIGSLIMLSDMVIDESLSAEEAKEMIRNVNEKSRHTLHVIDNLLSWITSQQEDKEPQAERFNITELVLRELKVQTIGAELKNINVESHLSDSIYAWGDAGMISTIIRNLLNNAVKFTEVNGQINIDIGSDDKHCLLKISNSGTELANQNQNLLLEENRIENKEKGFGLGLKLSKEYAKKNDCDLILTTNNIGGATAKLTIQTANSLH